MPLFPRAILLIFITLQSFVIFSQNNKHFSDSIRARKAYSAAIILGRKQLHESALDSFFHCLEIRKQMYGEVYYSLGQVYNGIGISYRALGQYDNALKYYDLSEKNYLSDLSKFNVGDKKRLYSNIGNVYRSKLDFNQALLYFNRTLEVYLNDPESTVEDIASINYKIADIYYNIDEYTKALDLIAQNIDNAYMDDQVSFFELRAYINQDRNNFQEAKKNYKKMIELTILLQEYDELSEIDVAQRNLNYSTFLLDIGEFDEALLELDKAFKIIQIYQPEYGDIIAEYLNLKGRYLREIPIEEPDVFTFSNAKIKNLQKTVNWYQQALFALKFPKEYSLESINSSEDWISLFHCIDYLKDIADTYKEIADVEQNKQSLNYIQSLDNALEHYRIAGALIQKARKEITGDESKIQLTELEYKTFHNVVATAFDAYNITSDKKYIEQAYQSVERNKSSSVYDKLSNELALENSLIPDSLIQLEKKYNNTFSIYSQKIFEENNQLTPNDSLIQLWDSLKFEANKNREDINQLFETKYSDYYELKYSASLLSIAEIQQRLGEEQIILEYVLNEKDTTTELYTFIISKNTINFSKQDVGTKFTKLIESMFHFMSNPQYMFTTNKESKQFCVESNSLYAKLIHPFLTNIQNKKLTIVADGMLNYIAFDALLLSLPDTSRNIQFNRLDYLIKTYTVNYSNSANLLFKTNNSSKKIKNHALAFAPNYNNDTIEIAQQKIVLPPLPGVIKEVNIIAETINTQTFTNEEATETNFRKHVQNYDILHLAMHAFINDSLPAYSRLAFAQDTLANNLISDGWLNTSDIYNLDLNARLTVLSACNTGRGQLKKGEGILSLARGFFYAGCPALIMSLWEVDDESGTEIMGSFYKNLKKGKNKDEALRLAKLNYLRNVNSRKAHPHYWLSYVSIGDNSALYKSYDFYFFSFLVFVLFAISIDQLIRIRKGRKKSSS